MIALEHKDTIMHVPCETPVNYLQNKGFPCNLQYSRIPIGGFQELKDGIHRHPARDVVESDNPLNGDSLESPKETPGKPIYQHEFGMWSSYYPDSPNMTACPMNAFEAQFYPGFVDNRFRYGPVNMIPQSYPHDYQFQDFQYFVVIDFEATCDKEKNPHPQEIIEFPSVIVSSMTGQLEACFQTYVRPTCNQQLTDFCKDLTGIQQIQIAKLATWTERSEELLAAYDLF